MFTDRIGMLLYNLVIRMYIATIYLAGFRNPKAKQWVQGRREWKSKLGKDLQKFDPQKKRIWMHCASYGEFEQGRPLLEAIRKKHPDYLLVLSFFSPSGYEAFKDWKGADLICYLPFDSSKNAAYFTARIMPEAVLFIKYEFWLNFLNTLQSKSIPTYLVSAVFKPHHPFFRWYGSIFRNSLDCFTEIFVQDENSQKLLNNIGLNRVVLSGDTRFDRVMDIRQNFTPLSFFERYCKLHTVIIAGSTWAKDELFLLEAFKKLKRKKLRLILVPHEVDQKSISEVQKRLQALELDYALYTEVSEQEKSLPDVLVVNTIGLLSRLYHYADMAYIGGGFDSGIHNSLEPAVHLKPLVFYGDGHHKYNEALDLIAIGAAKNVMNETELLSAIEVYLDNDQERNRIKNELEAYFKKKSGTTKEVMARLFGA